MMSSLVLILSSVGTLTLFGGLGFGFYKLFSYIRQKKNPVKVYIRKVVLDYLQELKND